MTTLLSQWARYSCIALIFGQFSLVGAEKPDRNRFTIEPVTPPNSLAEPMVFEVLPDGRAFIIERRGGIKLWDPNLQMTRYVGAIIVNTEGNNEQGLVGMTLDPNFDENGWIYLYYHHPEEAKAVLSRWLIWEDTLVANSEKVLLEFPAQRETCCHTGGGMDWDANGNLFMTTGNNRGNAVTAHTDERPGREAWDDQGGTANSNSLEGKILRIHPEDDGTYSIPEGNLFAPGTPNTRPEIYTMGHRNAWRVDFDDATGFLYWGEVGPDGRQDSERGPMGYDEFNQARGPGFFGWPYWVGESPFPVWDYAADEPREKLDPKAPVNQSRNNTGVKILPPLQPAFVYYPYDTSDLFPELGTGGRSATGGPVYRRQYLPGAEQPWPEYFEGKWLVAELSRRALFAISMDENGDYQGMERLFPDYRPVEPIDMKFGPDGALYVLEYGGRWFQASPEAKLTRISYEGGNRAPIARANADVIGGVAPVSVTLSADGTQDYDRDTLTYRWEVTDIAGTVQALEGAEVKATLNTPGVHVAWLTVTDPFGAVGEDSVRVVVGNEPPTIDIALEGNQSFYFPDAPLNYSVSVSDREDGSLESGTINAESVTLSIDYANADFDVEAFAAMDPNADDSAAAFPVAQTLIAKGNCKACHLPNAKLVGPAFQAVADKYAETPDARGLLSKKIVTGGAGAWGQVPMPPNYTINEDEAGLIVDYILSLAGDGRAPLPMAGEHALELPAQGVVDGYALLRAVYTDRGAGIAPALAAQSLKTLRAPLLTAANASENQGVSVGRFGATANAGAVLTFNDLDWTGVGGVAINASAMSFARHQGGEIQLRLDAPGGPVLAAIEIAAQAPQPRGQGGGRFRRGGARPEPVEVSFEPIQGHHSLYIAFHKEGADSETPLMNFGGLTLRAASDQ